MIDVKMITYNDVTSTQALDASGENIEAVFFCEDAGTIDRIVCHVSAIAGTSPTYDIRLETVDSNGEPSGTLADTTTNATFTPSVTGYQTVTLTSSYTCTQGEQLAIVVTYSSGTIDGSNNSTFSYYQAWEFLSPAYPTTYHNVGAGRVADKKVPSKFFALFDNGDPVHYVTCNDGNYSNVNEAAAVDRGNRFRFEHPMTITGIVMIGTAYATTSWTWKIFDEDDNQLATGTFVDGDNTQALFIRAIFDTSVEVNADEDVRITLNGTGTNGYVSEYSDAYSAAVIKRTAGVDMAHTKRTSGGAWTTTTDKYAALMPLCVPTAVAAGMKRINMNGGI